jgi:sec-independent protein translocase protein TatC
VPDDGRMTLAEHLRELRSRLFKSVIAVTLGAIAAWIYFNPIFDLITKPYCALPQDRRGGGANCHLYAFNVLDQFNVRIRVAVLVAVIVTAPIWLYQLWRFVTPALYRNERRWTLGFVGVASILFGGGSVLAYITLSKGLQILLQIAGSHVETLLDVSGYLKYVIAMVLIFGLSFEFPLLILMLNFIGVVSGRRLASWWRPVIFALFVFAAIATPSQDPFTMSMMAIPMCLLYAGAVAVCLVHDRRKAEREQIENWSDVAVEEPARLPAAENRDFTDIS